ncbi:MAG TPA: GNVR domain-containing protein [Chryseolinea sp.]|nr:GNVR domain-containing protein [Chryseolinea sp.]
MNAPTTIPDFADVAGGKESQGLQINFKRVLDRVIRLWYVIVISLTLAVCIAFLVNRYSSRIYPVTASIIIKENEENAGAKFLYNNALISPYRNFLNEIYIMKSYPLLQEVIESLGFDVSYYREGDIMTTEYYDRDFPVRFHVMQGTKYPYGLSMYFQVKDEHTYSLQYLTEDENRSGKEFSSLHFDDTIQVNGFKLLLAKQSSVTEIFGKRFVVRFNNPLTLAKQYSNRLLAEWAMPGASVVNLDINGPVAQKEIDFLSKFIERYQSYDVDKKNKVATLAMSFLDHQLVVTGDSLKLYEDQVENFKRRNTITGLGAETNRLYLKVQGYEEQKFQYKLNESYYAYLTKLLQSDQYDGIFTPKSVGISDNIVAGLITEVIGLQNQVNVYMSNKSIERSVDNPLLTSALQRIAFLKNDILKAIENSRKTEQISIEFIDDQIRLVENQLAKLPSTERELIDIQRNYSLKENLYVFLLQKRTEAGLSKASTTSDIVVVNPPMAAGAIRPKTVQNYVIASAAGLLLPILFFIVLEMTNKGYNPKTTLKRLPAYRSSALSGTMLREIRLWFLTKHAPLWLNHFARCDPTSITSREIRITRCSW